MDPGERFPEKLRDLVRRATAPHPGERPTMREVRSSLETLVERRGSGDTSGHHGRLMPLPPVSAGPDEHTMRVPDPVDTPVAGRSWAGVSRRVMIGGALAALILGGGAALIARAPDREPRAVAAEARPPARGGAGQPAASPAAVAPVTTAPVRVPTPAPSVSPAATPPASLLPSGHATPPTDATPAAPGPGAPAASPSPGASPRPKPSAIPQTPSAQRVDEGDVGPEQGDDDSGGDATDGSELGGRWELTHEIEATSHAPYAGLKIGYRLTLQQDGNHVYGRGRKYTENGALLPPDQRTAITVDGRIEGQYLVLSFVEQGAWRTSSGTIRWLIAPGADALQGRFASDAAQSSGTSVARRVR
jgi:hypothetical protein